MGQAFQALFVLQVIMGIFLNREAQSAMHFCAAENARAFDVDAAHHALLPLSAPAFSGHGRREKP
jgi:hypothetical protein